MKKEKVVISLKFGKIYSKFIIIVCLIGFLAGIITVPAFVILIIQEKNLIFLMGLFFLALTTFSCLFVYIKLLEAKTHVALVLKDGVELQGQISTNGAIFDQRVIVKFFYNGEKYKKISEKPSVKRPFLGHKSFQQYFGKTVRIIYSESQDDVLIIK